MNRTTNIITLLITVIFLGSCAVGTHPNEKIIIGTWRPVKVEKVVDSSAIEAAASMQTPDQGKKQGDGRAVTGGAASRTDAELDRLVQMEQRATMEIFPDKTAVKNFPGKPLHATWKMKGKGKKIIAKNTENKLTFVIQILEIDKERIVVLEKAPVGDIRITYERQFDTN
jgi:hypothetical protein